jgi:formamidopyrimidine-DNA glycosylase
MPELPEVEVTRQGIEPYVTGQTVAKVVIYHPRLRWTIPQELKHALKNQPLLALKRRGKYLLWEFPTGTMLIHFGMSGKLCIGDKPKKAHDHFELTFTNHLKIRLNDPRRFGCVLWTTEPPLQHPLLAILGPEPLSRDFSVHYLLNKAHGKHQAIKTFIMDSHFVVGVGNIYATEALFYARIHPEMPAGELTHEQAKRLVPIIKRILKTAIKHGGTTIRDFLSSHGERGYFSLKLAAYGREGEPCVVCGRPLQSIRQAQRTTTYCPHCQKR